MFLTCNCLLSSIPLRHSKKYRIFVVEAAKLHHDQNGYYDALNVEKGSDDPKEIKSAYRKLALKYHVSLFFKILCV